MTVIFSKYTGAGTENDPAAPAFLHDAYAEFDQDNVTAVLDGSDVVIETNGLPNHTSLYWSPSHDLFSEP